MPGKLYVVATPIGNLGDMTYRATEVLEQVDFIAAEDTRVSGKLLSAFEIKKPMISYFEHNRFEKGMQIAERIESGQNCALITDAGTPAVSDPGTDLVALCAQRGIEVVSVPGCCAVPAALSISGMPCGRFTFEGFLSVNSKNRREHLAQLKNERRTMVFYEAPHKLLKTLTDMHTALGDRSIALCREITKMHEQVLRTSLQKAVEHYTEHAPRGEFVLVIEGATHIETEPIDYLEIVGQLLKQGMSLSSAVKQVSTEHSIPKNPLYKSATAKYGKE